MTPTTKTDLFPCLVTAPDGTVYDTCRVTVSPQGTTVWCWSREARSGVAVLVSPGKPEEREAPDQYLLTIPGEGDAPAGEAYIIKEGRCGCGHPMRSFRPPAPRIV